MKWWQFIVIGVLTSAFLIVLPLILKHQSRPIVFAAYTACVYLLCLAFIFLFGRIRVPKGRKKGELAPVVAELPHTVYNEISMPIALCNENGFIVWSNRTFHDAFDIPEGKQRTLRSITGFGLERFFSEKDEDSAPINWSFNEHVYSVMAKSCQGNHTLVWWDDVTVAQTLRTKMEAEETFVAYIYIDNIDELVQIEGENTTSVASEISHKLIEWGVAAGGIIKEFERNKFIFVFSRQSFEKINQFEIFADIHAIPVGKSDIPPTISIGTSIVSGTMAEKDAAAKAALELALARGGDQAVIKSEDGIEYIGGLTKSSQKRSTVKSRTVSSKLTSLILESSNVLIMGHKYADFDAFGACIGMARLVMQCGKPCYIVTDRSNQTLTKCFDRLKSLHPYDNVFVTSAEACELIYSNTLLIIVDVNNPTQFESEDIANLVRKIVFVDHHRMNDEFFKTPVLHYIEPSASSACELVCEILEQTTAGVKLSKQEADLMLAGIMLDTKRFVVNTGVRTFSAAQYLRGQGANPNEAQELFRTGLDELIRKARFETNVQIYRKVIAISTLDESDNTAADRIAAAKVADNLLTIDGVLASFALCRIDDSVRVSARSTGKINVQIIVEKLGGGGHYDAAATVIKGGMDEAIALLTAAIDEYLD